MKHLKLFFALFAMLALGVGNAWGETTISFGFSNWDGVTANFSGTAKDEVTQTVDGVKVTYTRNGSNLYANTTAIRFYKSNTLKFDAPTGYSIQSIAFTCNSYQTDITSNVGTCSATSSKLSWSGDAISVTFTRPSTASSYATITGATVTLLATGGGENPGEGGGEDPVDPTPETGGSGTIVIKYNSTFAPALPTAKASVNTTSTAHLVEGLGIKEQSIYKGSSTNYLMFVENKGFLYNTQSLGTITSVSVTYSSGTSTSGKAGVYFGATEQSTYTTTSNTTIKGQSKTDTWTNTTEGNGFFQLSTSSKNVQITQIEITYTSGSEGGGTEEPDASLTDDQLKWSATTATALKGAAANAFPTLTNDLGLTVTYDSSNKDAATIAADGTITLVAPGTTTISAAFAGGEVSGTKYAAKTVTYTLTVKQLVSCADIYNLADNATFVLNDFVVTYVNGDYTYIKDDAGYGLIFTKDASDYDLKAGDKVASGKFEGKKTTYKTLVEIIPVTAYDNLSATSGEALAPEVMTTNPTNADINKYVKFEKVSFAADNFNSSRSINGTIEGQSTAIKFYNQFNVEKTFDTSKKYSVVGIVSIYESNLQVYFISAEEVAEPTLNVEITDADFGKVAINGTRERTLTLNGSLLTNAVSLAIEGEGAEHFKLASNSVTPTEGTITEAKIKITYKPTAEGTHTATLKITSDDVDGQTITLKGKAVQQHTVHFFVNGEEDETLAKKVLSGNTLEEIPEATSCDLLNYPTFAGWASAEIVGTTDVKPTMLDQSTPITGDCNYYAVFEKGTTSSGSTASAIMEYTGGTTTNMKDGNNAATVGLDETLFNITSTKTASGSYVGLNRNNDIRLYANKDDGNGNILTISMLDGSSITKITLNIKQEANFVVKANGKSITGADNVYNIDYPSCSIQNTTTGATTQLHLNSVTIEYTTSTTTYEYITSCAVVVPTCEITYDYADGEGECTTDIVEEGAEYTLCSTAPTKAGHTFLKWKDQNGDEYEAGATINSVTEDLTLTAQWQVNSYEVTWMSLGSKLSSSSYVNYNTQPTQPTTNPTYLCGTDKEFVGWTTQEIEGVGTPANLYTDEFPVVTDAITYHAVFASKIEGGGSMSKAVSLTNGETVYLATESGIGVTGANTSTNKDATVSTTQGDWMPFTVVTNGLQYQFKTGDNYITAAAKSFKITNTPSDFAFENGYIVYNVPSGSDPGDYVLLYNSNNGSFYRFYMKSNIGKAKYETFYVYKNPTHTDYVTSCEEVGSDMSNSTKVITPSVESGIFSVGDGKYVQFSTGNLQYEVGTNTWSFAFEQYEVIGGDPYTGNNNTNYGMNVPGYTGKLDLFAWSCDGKFGVNPSNADADYTGEFADWGKLVDETGWYTLNKDEMHYLLSRKKDDKKLWATAELDGKVVLILLPDNWDTTTNLAYGYVPATGNFEENVLDIDTWKALEEKGAVLLPSGGSRTGGYGNKIGFDGETEETDDTRLDANGYYFHVDNVGDYGYYWLNTTTSSEDCVDCAAYLLTPGFIENDPTKTEDDQYTSPQVPSREKRRGNSVRLVKEVPAYTVSVTAQNGTVTGAGTYPQGAEVTLTATAADGYKFTSWSNGETANPYKFTVTEDVTLTANFEVATVEPKTYTRTVTEDDYGTICLPYASSSFTGAEFYEVSSLVVGQGLWLDQLAAGAQLVAGKPYIFKATSTEIKVTYEGEEALTPVAGANGLTGTFTEIAANGDLVGNYIIAENKVWVAGTNATLPANRAYIANTVPTTPQAQIPGRRRVCMGENQTTGLDNITNGENITIKTIENGQLIIIRNGEKFNAQGQRL